MVDITKGSLDAFPPKAGDKIFTDMTRGSAFMKAAGITEINGDGEIYPAFSDWEANSVEEGGVKELTTPDFETIQALPRKFYVALPFSDELQEDHPEVIQALLNRSGDAIARSYDKTIASSATITGFSTLGGLTGVPLATKQDFWSTLSNLSGSSFQLVVDQALVASLRSQANLAGNDVFSVVSTNDPNQLIIEGIPAYVMAGTTGVGFVGDFVNNAEAKKVKDPQVKFKYAGFDIQGVDVAKRNMFVGLVEQRLTFVTNPVGTAFAKFVVPSAS